MFRQGSDSDFFEPAAADSEPRPRSRRAPRQRRPRRVVGARAGGRGRQTVYEGGVKSNAHTPPRSGLSIGALSQATGVPAETLRTWERRYGFPEPLPRAEGGHRRYPAAAVGRLRLVVRALALGRRASEVVPRSSDELLSLVSDAESPAAGERIAASARIAHWLGLVTDMRAVDLGVEMRRQAAETPVIAFLEDFLAPFLCEVGRRWASGQVTVAQEHLASERVVEFLSHQWSPMNDQAPAGTRPIAVLATPPGERHSLGLHMAAWVLCLSGVRVVFLGVDVPVSDVLSTAVVQRARAVVMSISRGYRADPRTVLEPLAALASRGIDLVLGGAGALRGPEPCLLLNRFSDLKTWSQRICESARNS